MIRLVVMILIAEKAILEKLLKNTKNFNGVKFKHSAFTGFLRNKHISGSLVYNILTKTEISPYIGSLPQSLINEIPKDKIKYITIKFREILDDFLEKRLESIKNPRKDMCFDFPEMTKLFARKCNIHIKSVKSEQENWRGDYGRVLKISFDGLPESFALKTFFDDIKYIKNNHGNGPASEVANAFCANRFEKKINNPVYMASLGKEPYILSSWAGDYIDYRKAIVKKNKILTFSSRDRHFGNFRMGKRIDFGTALKTSYGLLDYRDRKLYRKLVNVCEQEDISQFEKLYETNQNYIEKKHWDYVVNSLDCHFKMRYLEIFEYYKKFKNTK